MGVLRLIKRSVRKRANVCPELLEAQITPVREKKPAHRSMGKREQGVDLFRLIPTGFSKYY